MASKADGDLSETLVVLMPWTLPDWFAQRLSQSSQTEIRHYHCDMHDKEVPKEITDEVWHRTTVLFTWNAIPAKEQVPRLQYVQLLSAGCNQFVGKPLFDDTDVDFCTANGVHPPQIAEWVISTFLSFQHHLYDYWDDQKTATWVMPQSDEDTEDAVGLCMGILGYGSIGRQCAKLANCLGMSIHAFTFHERPTAESRRDASFTEPGLGDPEGEIPSRWFHGIDQLHNFLEDLDILVITLPLTVHTRGMIGRDELQILGRKKAFLSNAARGPIVKTNDLIYALDTGLLRGAALDVTDPEPLPKDHALWQAKNIIITPHVSGNSNHYNERVLRILAENLNRRRGGKLLMNRVNKALGY